MAHPPSEKDSYGTSRQEAESRLTQFLHATLEEPQAELADLHVEQGRWQSRVNRSRRGITVVFLAEHQAKLVPGHMTADAHATLEGIEDVEE